MTRYRRFLIPAVILVVVIGGLLFVLQSNLVYYNTPTEVVAGEPSGARMRLGGQVVEGSVTDSDGAVSFEVTDGRVAVAVRHTGAPQQMFQEGIGVVVQGTWDGAVFSSDHMEVSHDEQYRTESGEVYQPPRGDSP